MTMNKQLLQRSHPSLFPLRLTLLIAELETPAQPPRLPYDRDELLALKLIEKIRYPEPDSFMGLRIESPQPFQHDALPVGLASVHA